MLIILKRHNKEKNVKMRSDIKKNILKKLDFLIIFYIFYEKV